MTEEFLNLVREKARERILFLPHATRQMMHPDRMISTNDVRKVIFQGKIIEDYPDDARGHTCLILGYGDNQRVLHVVCAPKDEYLAIITAYIPSSEQWDENYELRR